jgi:hypothetical protein
MAFPTSPINGQTAIVNNTSYNYSSTYGTWTVATNPSNTFVTSTSGYTRATFVATAGQTTFTTPYTVGGVEVFINGVLMDPSDYTATTGTTIVLASGALVNSNVDIVSISRIFTAYNTRTYTGNGSATTYTVTSGSSQSQVLVTLDGVLQTPGTDYSITSTVLTFTTAPSDGSGIQIRELPR